MTTQYFKVKGGFQTGNVIIDGTVGNITSLNASLGNLVTANYFSGDGHLLTNIDGSQVTGQVANALVAGTVYSNAQPNITSVGTLSSLSVTANVSAGNVVSTGDVSGSTLTGTLTTKAQPNITSLGTLSSVSVSGNVSAGNISTTGTITTSGNITSAYFIGNVVGNISGTLSVPGNNTAVLFNDAGAAGADDALTFNKATSALTVTGNITVANANLGNLATANYFSGNGSLLTAITGANVTGYVPNADHATIANTANVAITVAGANVTGYVPNADHATIANTANVAYSVTGSNVVGDVAGADHANVADVANVALSINGANVSGDVAGANHANIANTANSVAGGNVTGQVANALIAGTVYSNAQPNITSVGTLAGVSVTGNIDATGNLNITGNIVYNNISSMVINDPLIYLGEDNNANVWDLGIVSSYTDGSGYQHTGFARNHNDGVWTVFDGVTAEPNTVIDWANAEIGGFKAGNITAGNISGANLVSANYISGTLTTQAQANITSTGTLNGVTATGTVDLTGASNVSLGPVGNLHISGGSSGYLLTTDGSGALTWQAPASTSQIVNGTSNVKIATANGNVTISANGASNVLVVSDAGANITGTLGVSGALTVASITTSGSSGNISGADYVIANYFQGNGSALSSITGANVTGYVANATHANIADAANVAYSVSGGNVTGQVANALIAGTVYTAAQPNITSVGTLASLAVTANVTTGGIKTDNYYYANGTPVDFQQTAGNAGEIQFNNSGSFGASDGLVWDSANSKLIVTNIAGNGAGLTSINGANVSEVALATHVTAADQANITSVGTLASLTVSGNITASNGNLGNLVTSNYFSGNGSLLSSITGANVTGQVANALVASTVYTGAQPNITSVGTLTSLSVSGTATVGNVAINNGIQSNRANVTVTTNTVVDQFAPTTFRTAKYIISASGDNGFQSIEALLVHDGSQAYITIYGSVCSNASVDIVDVSSNVNGTSGNVTLYATASGSNTLINVVATYLKT